MINVPSHSDLWGDIFEIAVKRGVINYLLHCQLSSPTHSSIKYWTEYTVRDLRNHVETQLMVTDLNYLRIALSYLDYLLVVGYGLGWTCMRQILKRFGELSPHRLQLEALWCPLNLRDRRRNEEEKETEQNKLLDDFWRALNLDGVPDRDWLKQGAPVRADFFLLLRVARNETKRFLLCLEFSLNAPSQITDFNDSNSHLYELESYARRMEKRGVFTRLNAEVSAEVSKEEIAISPELASYIGGFTSPDKPLFKLCQASSYITQLAKQLRHNNPQQPLEVQALAITLAGVEGLSATYDAIADTRIQLLETLGRIYRQYNKVEFGNPIKLRNELRGAFRHIARSLPLEFRQTLSNFLNDPPIGKELKQTITETITQFYNPNTPLPLAEITELLNQSPPIAVYEMLQKLGKVHEPCLRDVHTAAVWAGLNAAKSGTINVLALEGHPGIGKTTAVKNWLHQQSTGFLFLYLSPRVVINSKVMTELGETNQVLTLTSDSTFITNAQHYYKENIQTNSEKTMHYIKGAVAFAGIAETKFKRPENGILFLNIEQVQEIDQHYVKHLSKNRPISDDRSIVSNDHNMGVWQVLATATRQVLEVNPHLNQVALTAAIQGYRELTANTSTIDSLSKIFKYKHDHSSARAERQQLAKRLPTIIIMLDEITGDSAGVLVAKKLCSWLEQEFIYSFEKNSPFRIILVIADASLSNAHVLKYHLESNTDIHIPDKILISHGYDAQPLRLTVTPLRLNHYQELSALHIETFGFPAAIPLTLKYELRLLPIERPIPKLNEPLLTPRYIIKNTASEYIQNQIIQLITEIMEKSNEQIIFFAQDRELLETVASELKKKALPNSNLIATLHSGVSATKRDELMQPAKRDSLRVVLMTSSGSRGVSFPRATRIIALVPRFIIETSLMELAQLIYRGRGYYTDVNNPQGKSGDHEIRTLTFLINDFVISDSDTEIKEQLNQWARQALDFLTFVVLLRATILTRICGDAKMPQQKLAVVPVGKISSNELSGLLADSILSFIRELKTLKADDSFIDKGRFQSALERVERLFINSIYAQRRPSISNNGIAEKLSFDLIRNAQALVQTQNYVIVPDNLYCVGPLWLERMDNVPAGEKYVFSLLNSHQREEFKLLKAQLYALNRDRTLPKDFRLHAEILYTILNNEFIEDNKDNAMKYVAIKNDQSRQVWNCFPADYPRFMVQFKDREEPIMLDSKGWWNAFNRAIKSVCDVSSVLPALPTYKEKPFLVIITGGDPTDLQRGLDDRCFCASSEVNLLNALLFA